MKFVDEYYKVNFKSVLYTIFMKTFGSASFMSLVNICLTVALTVLFGKPKLLEEKIFNAWIIIIIVAIIICNILFYIANVIKEKNNKWKNLLNSTTKHISAINVETANNIYRMHKHTKSIISSNTRIDKDNFNKIADFQQLAFLVCKAIYEIVSEDLNCTDCEVTVYQKFMKEKDKRTDYTKMIAYATKDSIVPSTYHVTYHINKNAKNTNFMKMLKKTNTESIIIHRKANMKGNFEILEMSKEREEKICQYVGIPIKTNNNNVICVLQVDVSEEKILGNNYKDVKFFADNILKPFSSILYNAYERDCVINTLYDAWTNSTNS